MVDGACELQGADRDVAKSFVPLSSSCFLKSASLYTNSTSLPHISLAQSSGHFVHCHMVVGSLGFQRSWSC